MCVVAWVPAAAVESCKVSALLLFPLMSGKQYCCCYLQQQAELFAISHLVCKFHQGLFTGLHVKFGLWQCKGCIQLAVDQVGCTAVGSAVSCHQFLNTRLVAYMMVEFTGDGIYTDKIIDRVPTNST